MHAVTLTADAATALASNPAVLRVEQDKTRAAEAAPSDTNYADQWSLTNIGWDQV